MGTGVTGVWFCSTCSIITLGFILFSGGLVLNDLSKDRPEPSNYAVLALLVSFTAQLFSACWFFLNGLFLGKGIPFGAVALGWIGCFIGVGLFLLAKHQVSEKELKDANFTYKNWIIFFVAVGIGACSMSLFIPE